MRKLSFLREWVRDIVLLMFMIGFMEMFIPTGRMQKFIQMVVGFFMIMIILNPILTIMRREIIWRPFSFEKDTIPRQNVTEIINQGELLAQTGLEQAISHYQEQLEKQVQKVVMGIEGINHARALVLLDGKVGTVGFGELKEIRVWVDTSPAGKEVVSVANEIEVEVKIGETKPEENTGGSDDLVPLELQEAIRKTLNAFFNLDPTSIFVHGRAKDEMTK